MGSEPESDCCPAFYFSCFARKYLASADSLFRAEAEPGRKGRSVAESAYIGADLGKNRLRGERTDTWDIGEVNSCDAVQLPAQIKCRIINLAVELTPIT